MKVLRKTSGQTKAGKSKSGKVSAYNSKSNRVKSIRPLAPAQFIDIIEHINDGLVVLDKDWHYVYVNQKAAVMLQRQKPSDLIGKHIWTEYPEGVGQPFQIAYEKAMREQIPIVFEDHYEPWDLWFENRIYPSPDTLMILFTEITNRKRTERLLEERQHLLQKILDTEPGTVYIYDLEERRNVYINRYWLLAFGYTKEETQEMGNDLAIRIFHPDDLAHISLHHENWQQAGDDDLREIEYRVRAKTGEWHWMHSREVPFARTETGKIKQILGIAHDITEGKQAEEELRLSESRYRAVVENQTEFIVRWKLDGMRTFANEAYRRYFGLSPEQALSTGFVLLVAEEDQVAVQAKIARLISGEVRSETDTHRVIRPDGSIGWQEWVDQAIYDETGQVVEFQSVGRDVTERKQVEEALRESEEKFSKVFYASPIPLNINRLSDGSYVEVNESFLERLGYQREEMLGKSGLELGIWADPEEGEKILHILRGHGSLRNFEAKFRTKSGEIGTALLFREVVELAGEKHFVGTNLDITERKRTEEALATSETELRALFACMNDVVLVIDHNGVYRKIAPTNPSLLYKPPEELLGKTLREVFPAERAETFIDTVRQVIETGQTANIEYELIIDGRVVWFDASISRMDADSTLWMARDITDRKRAEERLRQLNEELEQRVAIRTEELAAAMIKAQESDRLKSAFLATMSHELRTPLNSIIGFTGVILQGLAGPLNEEQTKQLTMTRDSARHLLALINDVLDISKIEAGQLEIVKRPFDMRQAIENVLQGVQPLLQKKDLQLKTSIGPSVGTINQDRRRVEQLLINLVNNAIKFTERGEVSIECQTKDGWLETRVRDTGIGIKPENMQKLFKPFQQIETGLARSHEGTGLGLSICKHLVTAMGGEITVESHWGAGSIFQFRLPM